MGRVPVRCAPPPCGKRRLRRLSPLPSPHPSRLKEVVYTLSNHNQNVMAGLWKDLPYKVTKKVKENWIDTLFFLVPVIGTYECVPPPTLLLPWRTGLAQRLPAPCPLADGGGAAAHAAQCSARRRGREATLGERRVVWGHSAAAADPLLPRQVRQELQGEGEAAPPLLRASEPVAASQRGRG